VSPEPEVSAQPTWDYNDIILFIFLAVLSVGATQLLTYVAIHALHLTKANQALALMPSQVLLYGLLFGVLYVILKLQYGRRFLLSLGWVDYRMSPITPMVLGLSLSLASGFAARLLRMPDIDTPMKHLFDRRITSIEFGLIGITLGPLCEEFVFRGFMQPVFVRSLGPAAGILITAIFFGSLHLAQNGFAWQAGVVITLAGVAFGWMRHLSGSTKASTLMHSAYNFTLFLAFFSQPGSIAHK
jgi:uncharacterized protein